MVVRGMVMGRPTRMGLRGTSCTSPPWHPRCRTGTLEQRRLAAPPGLGSVSIVYLEGMMKLTL